MTPLPASLPEMLSNINTLMICIDLCDFKIVNYSDLNTHIIILLSRLAFKFLGKDSPEKMNLFTTSPSNINKWV